MLDVTVVVFGVVDFKKQKKQRNLAIPGFQASEYQPPCYCNLFVPSSTVEAYSEIQLPYYSVKQPSKSVPSNQLRMLGRPAILREWPISGCGFKMSKFDQAYSMTSAAFPTVNSQGCPLRPVTVDSVPIN